MQTPPHSWPELLYFLTGTLVGLIPSAVTAYRNWRKSGKEEAQIEAQTHQTQEETRSLRLRDDLAAVENIGKMMGTLMETGDKLSELQDRIFELEQDRIELGMARMDIKQLKGLLDAHGISYSEKDVPRG